MAKLPIDNKPVISGSSEAFGKGFSTRRAIRDDLPTLLKIESEITPFPWSARQFVDSIDSHEAYVLLKGKRVIAYLFYQQILDQAELLNIGVRLSFQGEGLGSQLLGFCLERIRASAAQLHLEVRASNFTAIGLYLSSGFKQVGERRAYYRSETGREDALLMTYNFPDPAN
jgi:ribosomal-protein-alanine N-acetyltransferase